MRVSCCLSMGVKGVYRSRSSLGFFGLLSSVMADSLAEREERCVWSVALSWDCSAMSASN